MDERIRRLLDDLEVAIARSQADGTIDDDERAELRELAGRVERALAEPEGEHEGVVDHLESAAVRVESDHPTLARVLRSAVDTLTGYGI